MNRYFLRSGNRRELMRSERNLAARNLSLGFALLLLPVLSLNAQNDQTSPPNSTSWFGFAAYPGARELCTESVLGTRGQEILWRSFATRDDLNRVTAFYSKKDTATPVKSNGSIELRHGDDIILSIHSAAGDYPKCDQKARAGEKTVIVVSQMISRGK